MVEPLLFVFALYLDINSDFRIDYYFLYNFNMSNPLKEDSWLKDLWFSPSWIFMKYIHLLRKIDFKEDRILRENKFKKVRETLAGANLALAVQSLADQPVYVQLSKTDPPDFFILQRDPAHNNKLVPWITYIEHTGHGLKRHQIELAKQLEASKLKYAQEYVYDYILLIEVEKIIDKDVAAVENLIHKKNIKYKVWMIEGQYQNDSKSIRIITLNTPFKEIIANPKLESERFRVTESNPAAFLMKLSDKDLRTAPPGQPDPWPKISL